jgi:hypothetical protein
MTLRPSPVWDFGEVADYVPPTGFVNSYVRYAIQVTDAPPLYHILAALGVVSAAVAPQTDLVFEGHPHPLHLFFLIIGDSSESRKSSSIKRAARVVAPVFEALHSPAPRLWWPAVSSPEGLVEELAKEPNRLMLLSEWTDLHRLSSSAGYWKHNTEFFNTLYDATDAHRARAKNQVVVTRPRVSILGASTRSLVLSATSMTDWLAGKMARYVIGCAARPADREMDAEVEAPELLPSLQASFGTLISGLPARVELTAESWEMIRAWRRDDWWRRLKERAPEHLTPSFARAQEHIFRIAALYEVTTAFLPAVRILVGPESTAPAIRLVEWCMNSLVQTFPIMHDENLTAINKVTAILQTAGVEGILRRDLLRRTKVTAKSLNEAVETLREREEIRVVETPTAGRPATRYFYVSSGSRT